MLFWGFVCVNQRDLREIYWGFFCADCLSTLACYSPADSADHAETNAASCIISQRKTDCVSNTVLWFGVRLRLSAGSAGDIGVYSVRIDWVRLRVILPQIAQITQRNAAKLHYFAEKDRLMWLMCFWGLLLGGCLRKSARSAGDIGGYSSLIVFLYKRNDVVGN